VRRSREILVLLGLLAVAVGFVLWYVADRKARQRAAPTPAPRVVGPAVPAEPVDLTQADGQTVDFSSGRPVIRNDLADQAALEAAKPELEAALSEVTFTPPPSSTPPPGPPPLPPPPP